jgi:hypothetical protein
MKTIRELIADGLKKTRVQRRLERRAFKRPLELGLRVR